MSLNAQQAVQNRELQVVLTPVPPPRPVIEVIKGGVKKQYFVTVLQNGQDITNSISVATRDELTITAAKVGVTVLAQMAQTGRDFFNKVTVNFEASNNAPITADGLINHQDVCIGNGSTVTHDDGNGNLVDAPIQFLPTTGAHGVAFRFFRDLNVHPYTVQSAVLDQGGQQLPHVQPAPGAVVIQAVPRAPIPLHRPLNDEIPLSHNRRSRTTTNMVTGPTTTTTTISASTTVTTPTTNTVTTSTTTTVPTTNTVTIPTATPPIPPIRKPSIPVIQFLESDSDDEFYDIADSEPKNAVELQNSSIKDPKKGDKRVEVVTIGSEKITQLSALANRLRDAKDETVALEVLEELTADFGNTPTMNAIYTEFYLILQNGNKLFNHVIKGSSEDECRWGEQLFTKGFVNDSRSDTNATYFGLRNVTLDSLRIFRAQAISNVATNMAPKQT